MILFLLFFLIAIATSVLSALFFAFSFQGLGPCTAAISLLLGLITSSMLVCRAPLFWQKKNPLPTPSPSFWEWFVIASFSIASAREFLWLLFTDGNLIKVPCYNNGWDLGLHITFIRYLAATQHWWPSNPLLIHAPLRYYIGMDLFNSLLLLIGIPLQQGLIWVGLLGAALTGIALWRWGRAFAMAALIFNGGLGGIYLFQGINPETLLEWKNLFLTILVTQRGFLYALPAGLFLLSSWRDAYFRPSRDEGKNFSLPLQAFFLGTMPFFQIYTFLFLSSIVVSLMFFSSAARRELWKLIALAWPLGLLCIIMVARGGHSMFAWQLGWMQQGNPFWFWLLNFGISLPLAAWLVVSLFFKSPATSAATSVFSTASRRLEIAESRAFVWPAAAIFIFCILVRIAPWAWDNTKLMIWSWLTIAPFLWRDLIAPCKPWLRKILCAFLFASGALTLFSWLDTHHGYDIARRDEIASTAPLIQYLPPDAVIAIAPVAPRLTHPVLWLGHPVAMSCIEHVWSHGLDYQKQLDTVRSIMRGDEGWESKAKDLGISAIYWGDREKKEFPESKLPFAHQQKAPMVYEIHKD